MRRILYLVVVFLVFWAVPADSRMTLMHSAGGGEGTVESAPAGPLNSSRDMPIAYITFTYGTGKDYSEGNLGLWESDTDINLSQVTTVNGSSTGTTLYVTDGTPFEDSPHGLEAGDTIVVDPGSAGDGPEMVEIASRSTNTLTLVSPGLTGTYTNEYIACGIVLDVYKEGIAGALWDENAVSLAGATSNASYFRLIRSADGNGHSGIPKDDGSMAGFRGSAVGTALIDLNETYASLHDLVLKHTGMAASGNTVVRMNADETKIIGCLIFDSDNASTEWTSGIAAKPGAGNQCYIINCLIHNVQRTGIQNDSGTAYIYNTTENGSESRGITYVGVVEAKNVIYSTAFDDGGTFNTTTCTNGSPTYVDSPNDDFHLQSGDSVAKDQGTDLSGDGSFSFDDDIDDEARSATWDIGFDEYN